MTVEKKEQTREMLFHSLEELMRQKPFEKIKVGEIAAGAGLSCRTFYNNFTDKYDLAMWHYRSGLEKILARVGNHYSYEDATRDSMYMMMEKKEFYRELMRFEGQNDFFHSVFVANSRQFASYVRSLSHNEELSEEIEFEIEFFYRGCIEMAIKWCRNGMKESPEDFIAMMDRCIPEDLRAYRLL
ncbi:MAG: TetR/AcrR family transcriptional regulator [Lachnospiraceae bacterium]|nr:TetR/AcrR family transcriptional regulator [Lachnospiraceae bacterium]